LTQSNLSQVGRTVVVIFASRAVSQPCLVVVRVLLQVLFVNLIHETVLVLTLEGSPHVLLLPSHVFRPWLSQLHMLFGLS